MLMADKNKAGKKEDKQKNPKLDRKLAQHEKRFKEIARKAAKAKNDKKKSAEISERYGDFVDKYKKDITRANVSKHEKGEKLKGLRAHAQKTFKGPNQQHYLKHHQAGSKLWLALVAAAAVIFIFMLVVGNNPIS